MDNRERQKGGLSHLIRRAREGATVTPPPPKEEEEKQPKWKKPLIVSLSVLGAIVILSGALWALSKRPPAAGPGNPTPAPQAATAEPGQPFPFRLLQAQEPTETGWDLFQLLIGDINGDGRDDLIWNMTAEINRTYIAVAQPDGLLRFLDPQEREERRWGGFQTLVGDVNGDGRDDLIWNETAATNRTYVALGQPSGTLQFLPAQDHEETGWEAFQTQVGDVNGDGRSDLVWNMTTATTNLVYVGLGQADGTFQFLPAQEHEERGWEAFQTRIGDVNGDGRDDLIWNMTTATTNLVYIGLGQEEGSFRFLPAQEHQDGGGQDVQIRVGDVNGDGHDDLVWNETAEANRFYTALGQEDGTFQFLPAQEHGERGWEAFQTRIGDVNGDGRDDLIWNMTAEINRTYIGLAGE